MGSSEPTSLGPVSSVESFYPIYKHESQKVKKFVKKPAGELKKKAAKS